VEAHCGSKLLSNLGVRRYVPQIIVASRCQADLEDLGATKGQIFLLVRHAWQMLDGGQALPSWTARLEYLHHL
jgi:hypothetical protein